MKEVQFGRFGNAAASMRRCAASVLVGFLDLGEFVLKHGKRAGFLQQAFGVELSHQTFSAAVFGVGLGLAPFERCEKRLLARDTIARVRELRSQLVADVEATLHEDWWEVARWVGLDGAARLKFVQNVGRAIDAAATSFENYPFRRLHCAPYTLLLEDDDFQLSNFIGRIVAAAPESLDAGFSLKIRNIYIAAPALLTQCAQSLEDVCRMLIAAPTSIYFCERAHKFSSKGHKGMSSFIVVNETAWCERFMQNNLIRAPDLDEPPKGPTTLGEAWKKSGASSVRANTLFFGEQAAKSCTLKAQKTVLVESHKTYLPVILAQPEKLNQLRERVEERRVRLRSRAAEKLGKTLAGVNRLEERKCDLAAHYLAVNSENLDAHVTHRSFFDAVKQFEGKLGLDAAAAAVKQRELDDAELQRLATLAEENSFSLPYFHLPDLDYRVTELIRRSKAKEQIVGGLLFVRPRRADAFLLASGFEAFQISLAVHQPYSLGGTKVEIIADDGVDGTTFWKQGRRINFTTFAARDDLFFLPPTALRPLSAACDFYDGVAITEHNLAFVPGVQKLSLGKTLERRGKAADVACRRKRAADIRKNVPRGRNLEVNATSVKVSELENYDQIADAAREELRQVREAATEVVKHQEDDVGHLVDAQCRAFPRGSGWTMVHKKVNVDVWRCQIIPKNLAAQYKSLGLFSMKDASVSVWGGEEFARRHALLLRRIVKFCVAHGLAALSSPGTSSLHARTCQELFRSEFEEAIKLDADQLKGRGEYGKVQRSVFFESLLKLGSKADYQTEKMATA
eukprot:g20286.t1